MLTSRTYDCWLAVNTMLTSLFPDTHVEIADEGRNEQRESLIIAGVITRPQNEQDWATLGQAGQSARAELFGIIVAVVAANPGQTQLEAIGRLRYFTDTIEAALRLTTAQGGWLTLGDVPGVRWTSTTNVEPHIIAEAEGWTGYAEITIGVHARI